MLREFWRALTGAIHPEDRPVFEGARHSFNLDFPPPAFVGNPDAPVVLLYANGGYDPALTSAEFSQPGAVEEYLDQLHGRTPGIPAYYKAHAVSSWLEAGLAVRVNAVAYRSRRLSAEPENRRLAELLPSVEIHRRWLQEVVLPEAKRGSRFLIVHRNGMWGVPRGQAGEHLVFSPNPVSAWPATGVLERARAWLTRI